MRFNKDVTERRIRIAATLLVWLISIFCADPARSGEQTVRQGRIQIPDSLVGKLGSGLLEMRVNERLQAALGRVETQESEKIPVNIYLPFYPSMVERGLLAKFGIILYPESWTPPMDNHPYGFIFAELPPWKFLDVLALPFVKKIDTAERTSEPQNNDACRAIKADLVWAKGYTGTGVKVAVLDSGIDVDYAGTDLPAVFEKKNYSNYPTIDDDVGNTVTGHGTHVAGTVLGRGALSASNTGNGGGPYKGMAPDANLVFLKIGRNADGAATNAAMEGAMTDAVNVYHAKIITMSYGGWDFYNDGSESTEQKIDWCYSQGTAVFISAGNDGNKGRHFSGTVGPGQSGYIQVNVSGVGTNNTKLEFNLVWRDGPGASMALDLHYYNSIYTELTDITRYTTTESLRGTESKISLYNSFLPTGSGTYYLKVSNSSSNTVAFHLFEFWGNGRVTFASPDPQYTVSSPSTADHAVSVAAWTSRKVWRAADSLYHENSSETVNAICTFSSHGPRIDGTQKPDLAAPGSVLISLRDTDVYTTQTSSWVDNDNVFPGGNKNYYVMQGTSMSCPAAAGAAALLLSKDPSMTPQDVYDTMKNYARHDSYTDVIPNSTWGYGKLNADSSFSSTVFVEAKVFLEGAYAASGDTMTWNLRKAGQVPSTPPYTEDNARSITIPSGTVDWVLVQLRNVPSGAAVASKSALLRKDGRITADDGTATKITIDAPAGNYYLVVKHRNHGAGMSSGFAALSTTGSTLYDFTANGMLYGTNPARQLKTGVWGLWSGDINQDGQITTMDYTAWYNSARLGDSGYKATDINLNVQVTTEDYTMWYNNARLGAASGVP